MTREEAAKWLTRFFLPPMTGHGESLRAESAAKFEATLLALTAPTEAAVAPVNPIGHSTIIVNPARDRRKAKP